MVKTLLQGIGHFFSQHSLRTQISALALGMTLLGAALIGTVSYQRQKVQVLEESTAWATSVAQLAARSSVTALQVDDLPSIDSVLQEIATMPGVRSVQLVRPGGAILLRVEARPGGLPVSIFPRGQQAVPPGDHHRVQDQQIQAWASLLTPARGADGAAVDGAAYQREGWIELTVGTQERMHQALRNWVADLLVVAALVVLALWAFAVFLARAFRPMGELARFSKRLASEPGSQVRMRWGSSEVRELGRTLNASSSELARLIDSTQRRLSRLRAILDTAADAVIGVTAEGRIDSANPAAERMFGLLTEQIVGRPLAEVLIGMDASGLQGVMDNGMLIHSTQSRIGKIEINALRHGGTEFPVEVLLGEIAGDPDIRYTCIVRDLSDTKLAEEYLTLYGRAVDCTLNGIMISDARRYPQPIVYVNPAFTRITEYAAHEVLGRDAALLEGPETDKDDLQLLARTVQAGGELTLILRNYRKSRTLFHNKLSVSPVRAPDGTITHYINVIEDVTGQIEVKQRLIERTARLNATFDLSPDGFAVFDARGELISSNPAFRSMVGDIPDWCTLARFDVWFKNLCQDFDTYRSITEAWNDKRKDTIAISRPAPKVLEREIRRNLGGSGETILYFRDVTHQVEVDRIKSEFLATAAHELRTPLASILGFTELLIHRKYSEDKQKDLLQTVHRQGNILQNLIQELLDLSRIEARQGKDFHIVPTGLAGIVRNALEDIASQGAGRGVVVGDLPELAVMADPDKVEQALTNLLSNAFKYSPGGGEVRLEVAEVERDGEGYVVLRVHDQGIGMTPAQLARAFERFYRADSSGNIPGTGLGLNLVKEIAEIHGGKVDLSSEHGVGTVASLWLKSARAPVEATAGSAA